MTHNIIKTYEMPRIEIKINSNPINSKPINSKPINSNPECYLGTCP